MTISFNWLCEYLPTGASLPSSIFDPEKLSKILTNIGLEVESLEPWESVKGGLKGLVIGEVISCEKHPDADKLSITSVNLGSGDPQQIVCGAPNVKVGQKVVVAPVGATIYPLAGEPMVMKKVKIRGAESYGMICAEDEIGIGESHDGIMVLEKTALPGTPASDYFNVTTDWIYEIGLTPNRMDAMSHLGVARDVCAWLSYHHKIDISVKSPLKPQQLKADEGRKRPFEVVIENTEACQRYSGITIAGVTIGESPEWLKTRLRSIGLRPISNVVDITNFILHETGQPLHAFDADQVKGDKVIVKNLPAGTPFMTLDEKDRKLSAEDLMICNGEGEGMCIGGVFGGIHSGVTASTSDIFLESAWFNPVTIRKTSFLHGLRTDAATRFEKGTDISNTVAVLKRAALLIKEICGGRIASDVVDIYPHPKEKTQVALKFHYLKKLSGKNYHPDAVRKILEPLGFEYIKEGMDDLWFAVPFSKPDISLPADIVEEIMRIDGYDNVEIPSAIMVSPSADVMGPEEAWKEKLASYLVGLGFNEIFTNSITNSKYYSEEVLATSVKMMNNLSADLDIMRPSMLETGLESIAWNLNRKNNHLQLFEFGKTYTTTTPGDYQEQPNLTLLVSGQVGTDSWKQAAPKADLFYLKGVVQRLLQLAGIEEVNFTSIENSNISGLQLWHGKQALGVIGLVNGQKLSRFDIRQPVYYASLFWDKYFTLASKHIISFKEISRFPSVDRDLAIVVNRNVSYAEVEAVTQKLKLNKLRSMRLFDVFESDKLGIGKKSLAISFVFSDAEKTLTDKETEAMMEKITSAYENELGAEIRK